MKRFRVEHKDWYDNPTIVVTLYHPPYKKENILHKTKWDKRDVTITDITPKEIK